MSFTFSARTAVMTLGTLACGVAAWWATSLLGGAASATPTCTIYWTGATSSVWTNTANWSLTDGGSSAGQVPGSTDFVCMSSAPARSAVTYASGTSTNAGINFPTNGAVHPTLTVTGGSLTTQTNPSSIDTLVMAGGSLAGTVSASTVTLTAAR